jgi:hypothetical protein
MDAGLGRVLQIRTVLEIAIVQRMSVDEDVRKRARLRPAREHRTDLFDEIRSGVTGV